MVKRYETRYVKNYPYKSPDGEEENIVYMPNSYLFPLFKSFTGIELSTALNDYKANLTKTVSPEIIQAVAKFEASGNVDEKIAAVTENSDAFIKMLEAAEATAIVKPGLSLIELLLIVMRVCALPESEHAEALAVGMEILPQEVYENPELAFELLELAIKYDDHAKKNSTILQAAKKKT